MYFDHNATSPINKDVWEYLTKYCFLPLNASSPHQDGKKAKKLLEDTRYFIANYLSIDLDKYSIIFTSSATEANNMILRSMQSKMKVYVLAIEHSSVMKCSKGNTIHVNKDGLVDLEHLREICKEDSNKMISIGYANGVTGVLQDISEVGKICKEYNVLLHSDCTQAISKVKVNLQDCDFITFSGHKLGAPVGSGVCIFPKNIVSPFIVGGNQEFGLRGGTENILSILGLKYVLGRIDVDKYVQHTGELRRILEDFLASKDGVVILSKDVSRLSNTTYFISDNCSSEELLIFLDMFECSVSTGSACMSGISSSSGSMKNFGYNKTGIRVSFGMTNTVAEVEKLCEVLNKIL